MRDLCVAFVAYHFLKKQIIKDWTNELQEQSTRFRKQAEALSLWDRRIISNRNVLIKLEVHDLSCFCPFLKFGWLTVGVYLGLSGINRF